MLKRSLVCAGAALALGGAGGAWSQPAPHEYTVTMTSMSYGKIPSGVKVGDTIAWVNRDTVPHTATARDKSFDLRVFPGHTARMTVQKAGTIPFYCIYHSTMRGTLTVAAR